jgi:hypothetical protein
MSGFLKLILVGLAILFVYGYITRPAVPPQPNHRNSCA